MGRSPSFPATVSIKFFCKVACSLPDIPACLKDLDPLIKGSRTHGSSQSTSLKGSSPFNTFKRLSPEKYPELWQITPELRRAFFGNSLQNILIEILNDTRSTTQNLSGRLCNTLSPMFFQLRYTQLRLSCTEFIEILT